MRVYLGLGSNMGNRCGHLARARRSLERGGVRVLKASPVYETEPVGRAGQRRFLNQALGGETGLSPWELLALAKEIEKEQGRKPGPRNGPRPIDIDILFLEDTVLETAGLTIPHPRLAERRFVLVPLADIAPGVVHPGLKKTVRRLLCECPDASDVRLSL